MFYFGRFLFILCQFCLFAHQLGSCPLWSPELPLVFLISSLSLLVCSFSVYLLFWCSAFCFYIPCASSFACSLDSLAKVLYKVWTLLLLGFVLFLRFFCLYLLLKLIFCLNLFFLSIALQRGNLEPLHTDSQTRSLRYTTHHSLPHHQPKPINIFCRLVDQVIRRFGTGVKTNDEIISLDDEGRRIRDKPVEPWN